MADTKISNMTAASALTGAELVAGVQSGANVKITTAQIATLADASALIIGTTPITSGTTARILYDNAGVLGEYTISGSGTVVAMATSAVLTTPTITTSILPTNDDGAPLGSTSKQFSDLFLASGGVINWNNGAVTLTQAANTLTLQSTGSFTDLKLQFGSNTGLFEVDGSGNVVFRASGNSIYFDAQSAGDINFRTTNGNTLRAQITNAGNVVCNNAAIATNATDGFLYISTCNGTPTGTPTGFTGRVALVYDTSAHQFWIYDGGWKQPKTPAAAAIITWQ